jgi:uncharacterized protein (TIGR04255 family)
MAVGLSELKIDVTESFPHLPHAPIVEAVIEIRARAEFAWEERVVSEHLKSKLPDFPRVTSQSQLKQEVKFELGQPPETKQHDLGWKGLQFQSSDGLHIAQFNRDGFVFSRLQPYESWERMRDEALRLWCIHMDLAQPTEIQRLGLRFINRIALPVQETRFEGYLMPHPVPPQGLDLPFHNFFHHDTLAVPGHPYAINVVRTILSPQDPQTQGIGLILDIDVFATQRFELRRDMLESRLGEMRWLKNKVFFGSVTSDALARFQ